MKRIDPGKLDRKIVIQAKTKTRATSGQFNESWGSYNTVWAMLDDGNGNEVFESDQKVQVHHTTWILRYRNDLNTTMRIHYNGSYYDILNISEHPEFRKTWLILKTELKQ